MVSHDEGFASEQPHEHRTIARQVYEEALARQVADSLLEFRRLWPGDCWIAVQHDGGPISALRRSQNRSAATKEIRRVAPSAVFGRAGNFPRAIVGSTQAMLRVPLGVL